MFSIIGNWAHNKFIYLLWLAAGKSSFLRNIVEEIRPDCGNLQRSLIMINLSEIFLGGMLKVQSGVWFKNMGWSRISLKKSLLFCYCKFLGASRPLRVCFFLKKATSSSEFRISFNQYRMGSFQKALVGFNNLWIHLNFT